MWRAAFVMISAASFIIASFSSSTNYQLKSYGVGPGGTNSASSTTYDLQGSAGEQANGSTAGSTKTANNGSIQTEQLNVPGAPTLGNGSSTFYNMLSCIVNTSSDPSDSTYAIKVYNHTTTTTSYVQASDALGGSAVYQSYSAWGSGSGFSIIGLTPSTTYDVSVAAKEGQFTNTEYGPIATLATVSPNITFSVSPNSSSLGSFLPGTIVTSSNLSFTYVTNGATGGNVYVMGKNSGLKSTNTGGLISAVTGNLSSLSSGFGVQATNPSQTSGGPLTTVSPFNGTSHSVGAETTSFQPIFSTSAAIVGGTANANVQALASNTTPAASDYNEVLTFIAAANF
jgi:hypothetical protein